MAEAESRKLTVESYLPRPLEQVGARSCVISGQSRDGQWPFLSECMVVPWASAPAAQRWPALELLLGRGETQSMPQFCAAAVQSVQRIRQMTGIGGDCFVLYAKAGSSPQALNASGRASEKYRSRLVRTCLPRRHRAGIHSLGDCTRSRRRMVPPARTIWQRIPRSNSCTGDQGSQGRLQDHPTCRV